MKSSEFITEHFLLEGATDTLFHYTGINAALKILSDGEFHLSSVVGNKSEEQYAPKGYPYFLSTTRSRVGDYHRWVSTGAVMFVLNGQWFQQRYPVKPIDYWERAWQHSPDRTRESEDRVFSREPTIPLGGVRKMHVLLKEQDEHRSPAVRKILLLANKTGIKAYLYTNETAWRLQDDRRAINISGASDVLKGVEPQRTTYPQRKYLSKWLELIHKKSIDELSSDADKLRYNMQYYSGDGLHNLDIDLHNARKPDAGDHDQAIAIIKYMRANKMNKLQQLFDHLKDKWRQISELEKR